MSVIRERARSLAEAAWDEASFVAAVHGRTHPDLVRAFALGAEIAQRPRRALRIAEGPVRIAFLGNDRQLFATLAGMFGATSSRHEGLVLGRRALDEIAADVTALEIPWFEARRHAARGALVLPRWIGLEVDLARERLDERRRASMRKAEARGLVAEIVPAETQVDEFYARFYAPTAHARHGEHAFVRRERFVRQAARGGELLFVREGAERRAGILLVPRRGTRTVDAWLSGVAHGDYHRADSVVRDALYVFSMRHARSRGFDTLGLTAAAPFLGDGLFRYKRSFGARAVPVSTAPIALALHVRNAPPALVQRVRDCVPVLFARGGLSAFVLDDETTEPPRPDRFAIDGVVGPHVVRGPRAELPRLLEELARR